MKMAKSNSLLLLTIANLTYLLLSDIAIKPAKVIDPKKTYVAIVALTNKPISDSPMKIKAPTLNGRGFTSGICKRINFLFESCVISKMGS